MSGPVYCFDTSGFLDGWVRSCPPDLFPSVWERMHSLRLEKRILFPEDVVLELKKKEDDDGTHWVKSEPSSIVLLSEGIQRILQKILTEHPRLIDTRRNRSGADPMVIATAEFFGAVVVTGEKPTNDLSKPRIPDVCHFRKIRCIAFLDLIREEKWRF